MATKTMENEKPTLPASDEKNANLAKDLKAGGFDEPAGLIEIPGGMKLLPPAKEACQICARNPPHPDDWPHNRDSLYYQYRFLGEHGRWPTWTDAMEHCTDEMKAVWLTGLRDAGVAEELITGPAEPGNAKVNHGNSNEETDDTQNAGN